MLVTEETYGARVMRLRKRHKWTQEQLCRESGVSLRTIQAIEAGESRKPQRANVLALNRALGIEGDPDETRSEWPIDVRTFLDITGAYLAAMPEQSRMTVMRDVTKRIIDG